MDQPEVNEKIKSAIKAKLKELETYVDDDLPDYILVMVANKKSMLQMEDDLEIFLHDRSKEFTKWLFAVLEKLNRVSKVKKMKGSSKDASQKKDEKKKSQKTVHVEEVVVANSSTKLNEEKIEPEKKIISHPDSVESKAPNDLDLQTQPEDENISPPVSSESKNAERSLSARRSTSRKSRTRSSSSSSSSRSRSRGKSRYRRRSKSSSSRSSLTPDSSRYKRVEKRKRSPLRLRRRSQSPYRRRSSNRDIKGRNFIPRRHSRSPRKLRYGERRRSNRSTSRHSPSRRSPPRRTRHHSVTLDPSSVHTKDKRQVSSTIVVVKKGDEGSEYNPMDLLKQSVEGTNRIKSKLATPTVSKSKKKAVPNPVKIASLVIQAAQEADKSIKKMSEKEREREAIIEKIQARANSEGYQKHAIHNNSSKISDVRQRIGPRISSLAEHERGGPKENFVIEIRNSHLDESDLRQRLSNRSSQLTQHTSTSRNSSLTSRDLKATKIPPQSNEDDSESIEEIRRRALASMARRREAAKAKATSEIRHSNEKKKLSKDSSNSSDESSSESSDTDSSSGESTASDLPNPEEHVKRNFEPTFVVTLDGIDESYFESRKKLGHSTNQLNLSKAKYNDNPLKMGRGIDEPIIVRHSKGISVPVLEAVGGGGGVQDPRSLEIMHKLFKQPPKEIVGKAASVTPTLIIKKEKLDEKTQAKECVKPTPKSAPAQKTITPNPRALPTLKRPAPTQQVNTLEKKKRPRIEAPPSTPRLSTFKLLKPQIHYERKEKALSPVAPNQAICRYWPNCTRGFQCVYYHPKPVKPLSRAPVTSDRFRWRAEQTRT